MGPMVAVSQALSEVCFIEGFPKTSEFLTEGPCVKPQGFHDAGGGGGGMIEKT